MIVHFLSKALSKAFIKAKRGLVLAHGGFGADIPYRTIFDPKLTAEIGTTCQPGATSEA